MDEEEDEVQYKGGEEMIEEEEHGGGGANHLGADLHLTKLQPASQQRNPRRKTRWFSTKMVFTHFEGNKPSRARGWPLRPASISADVAQSRLI